MTFPKQSSGVRSSAYERGFVTLYAAIVIVMLSGLAFAIGAVGLRQYQVVSTGAISQTAQYYAESGMECALYARLNAFFNAGATTSCVGVTINNVTSAQYSLFFPGGGCVNIQFTATDIIARGYDQGTSGGACPGPGARVERGYIERQLQSALNSI